MVLPLLRTSNNLQHTDDEKHVSGFRLKLRTRNLQKLNSCFLNTLYGKNTAKIFFFCSKRKKYTAMVPVLRMGSAVSGSRAACCRAGGLGPRLLRLQSFIKAKIILRREETSVTSGP